MSDDDAAREARRKQVNEAIGKAREGAGKLAGWLGRRVEAALESAKNTEIVRRKMGEFGAHREQREQERREVSLTNVYDAWLEDLVEAIQSIKDHVGRHEAAVDQINHNISDLQLRGVGEDDDEMQEYRSHVAEMRADIRQLDGQMQPFRDEMERVQRHRRAAVARLQSEVDTLQELQEEAQRHLRESRQRLGTSLSEMEGDVEVPGLPASDQQGGSEQ